MADRRTPKDTVGQSGALNEGAGGGVVDHMLFAMYDGCWLKPKLLFATACKR